MSFSPSHLKAARLAAGMRQDQLAEIAGVARSALQLWETGKTTPNPTSLRRLAGALQVPTTSLYSVPPPSTIHDRIRFQRKSQGLSQVELAHILGVKVSVLQKWESGQGKPDAEILARWLES